MLPFGGFWRTDKDLPDLEKHGTPWVADGYSGPVACAPGAAWSPAAHAGPMTSAHLWSPMASVAAWDTPVPANYQFPGESGAKSTLLGWFLPMAIVAPVGEQSLPQPPQLSARSVPDHSLCSVGSASAAASTAATPRSRWPWQANADVPSSRVSATSEQQGAAIDFDATRLQELLDSGDDATLVQELQGSVRDAAFSVQGYMLLQQLLQTWPVDHTAFIIEEFLGSATEVARNKNGSQVLCSLIERYSNLSEDTKDLPRNLIRLLDELMEQAASLCRHVVGHRVVELLLEQGSAARRMAVAEALRGNFVRLARNCTGSRLVQKILECGGPEELHVAATELLSDEAEVLQLAQHRFGRHVVKTLAKLPNQHGQHVRQLVKVSSALLRGSKYGSRFLLELQRDSRQAQDPGQWEQHCGQRRRWSDELSDEERKG